MIKMHHGEKMVTLLRMRGNSRDSYGYVTRTNDQFMPTEASIIASVVKVGRTTNVNVYTPETAMVRSLYRDLILASLNPGITDQDIKPLANAIFDGAVFVLRSDAAVISKLGQAIDEGRAFDVTECHISRSHLTHTAIAHRAPELSDDERDAATVGTLLERGGTSGRETLRRLDIAYGKKLTSDELNVYLQVMDEVKSIERAIAA
jgi:hypothetical protein